jgi:hypothetical protein
MCRSRTLFIALSMSLAAIAGYAQKVVKPVVSDVLSSATSVHLNGFLADKLKGSIDNRTGCRPANSTF